MNSQPKTVALAEWNWMGHHPNYFIHFILALEELGIDVLALCPYPAEAEKAVDEARQESAADIPRRGRTQFRKISIPQKSFSRVLPVRISAIAWTVRHFRGIENQVREWARESGNKVDAIFYACIYDVDFYWHHLAQRFLHTPWCGLYLHAMSFRMPGRLHPHFRLLPRPERYFRGPRCKGIGILDEGIVAQVAAATGKPVVVFPDFCDERPPSDANDCVLGNALKRFACGRPTVGLFGHLRKSKGIMGLLEAARMPAASQICFALGGELYWNFEPSESHHVQLALAECPNIWTHLARIPGEKQINSLISACDVVYAAYLDFPNSSNMVAKAAAMKKPLIVSEGYIMAERVRRFKMGEVVPQGDAQVIVDAIIRITRSPTAWVTENQPRWSDYLREHSLERLKQSFSELLGSI